ncbi:alpha/beta hydrolase [Candidatus Woesebacteria bacterium]|nr:alpha/beta hydrolase [Candidatus Woesebacteria bacterium]
MSDHTFKLKDGRKLGYAQYGDPKGKPLFFFHGWPSTRLHGLRVDKAAQKLGIRVISTDRPGMGLSDFQRDRTLLDFPDDIVELADHLQISTFSVMGVSGGGPYAAVCAYRIPKRIHTAAIVVGLAPTYIKNICDGMAFMNKLGWSNYLRFPALRTIAGYLKYLQNKLGTLNPFAPFPSEYDKQIFHKSFTQSMNRDLAESIRQGIRGIVHELKIYTSNWGFEVKDIRSHVYLYYGRDDKNVSLRMGKYYKDQIPNSILTIYEGGHLSWIEHAEEILQNIVE